MVFRQYIPLLMLLIAQLPLWPQCATNQLESLLVADRYEDSAQFGQQLILANSHGLVYFDLETLDQSPEHIEPLAGEVNGVSVRDNRVYATAANLGLYVFEYDNPLETPSLLQFNNIPDLVSHFAGVEAVFALTGSQLIQYRPSASGKMIEVDRIPANAQKVVANDRVVFLHQPDGSIAAIAYDQNGFQGEVSSLNIGGNRLFYDLSIQGQTLVLDALNGVQWAEFDHQGSLTAHGHFFRNLGIDIVLGTAVSETKLVMSFAERIEVYDVDDDHNILLIDTVTQPFSDVGITKFAPTEDHLHLLNLARKGREWSLTSYRLENNNLRLLARLDSGFQEITHATSLGQFLYVASDNEIYLVDDLEAFKNFRVRLPLEVFDGAVIQMAASQTLLFVATLLPDSTFTQIHVFQGQPDGSLLNVHAEQLNGTIQEFAQFNDTLAFTQFFRTTTSDQYQAHVLTQNPSGAFVRNSLERAVPIQENNPFSDIHMGELGLIYHDGRRVTIHENPQNLTQLWQNDLSKEQIILRLVTFKDLLGAETADGLRLILPSQNSDGSPVFEDRGLYPHWQNVYRLPNNLVLAQSQVNQGVQNFHLLNLTESEVLFARTSFSTSTLPLSISSREDDLVVVESSSLTRYQFQCPPQDFFYLIPFDSNLEIEITSQLSDLDVFTMTIFNEQGKVIGLQNLNGSLIRDLNGAKANQWIFDFNHMEDEFSFILSGNIPLAPVISGFADADEPTSRFAYTVPLWGATELYSPHIPKDFSAWITDLYISNYHEMDQATISIQGASGQPENRQVAPGATEVVRVQSNTFDPKTPWVRIFSESLGTVLSGFTLYQSPHTKSAAAVPLVSDLSTSLNVPFLAGKMWPGWWTGIVLANPNGFPLNLRIIGYDENGEIRQDRNLLIDTLSSLILLGEDWVDSFDPDNNIQWLTLVSESPITGLMLFGKTGGQELAGLPLAVQSGTSLLFSGIRVNDQWDTSLQITSVDLEPGMVYFEGLNGEGKIVATAWKTITGRGSTITSVNEIFEGLEPDRFVDIQSIRLVSDTDVCGSLLRQIKGIPSLEAASAWVEFL